MLCPQISQPIMTLLLVPSLSCPRLTCTARMETCLPDRYQRRMSFKSNHLKWRENWINQTKFKCDFTVKLTRVISSQFITQSPPPAPPPPPPPPQVNGSDSSPFPKITNGMMLTSVNSRPSTGQVKVRKYRFGYFPIFSQTRSPEVFPCFEMSILQIWWLMNKSDLNLGLWSSYSWLTLSLFFISLFPAPRPHFSRFLSSVSG